MGHFEQAACFPRTVFHVPNLEISLPARFSRDLGKIVNKCSDMIHVHTYMHIWSNNHTMVWSAVQGPKKSCPINCVFKVGCEMLESIHMEFHIYSAFPMVWLRRLTLRFQVEYQ